MAGRKPAPEQQEGQEGQEGDPVAEELVAATLPAPGPFVPQVRTLSGGGVHPELPGLFLGDGVHTIVSQPDGAWRLVDDGRDAEAVAAAVAAANEERAARAREWDELVESEAGG